MMSFLETVARARAYLEEFERVSLRALQRECDIEGDSLEDLVQELCSTQGVARLLSDQLEWIETDSQREAEPETASSKVDTLQHERDDVAEHRQLTVLFCDLQGSTELAQSIDAEEYRALLAAYYDEAKQIIEAYGGYVAQYMGDGLMVYFGYPVAHEDDPERAVRTGLDIIEALVKRSESLERRRGVRLSARVGIHTGPVVVGELTGHGDSFAIGDTLNCAARIQGKADSNTVMISETTHRRVERSFHFEDKGLSELKGVTFPLHLYQPLRPAGVQSRFEAVRNKPTEFVGRGQEIGILAEKWATVETGSGQAILITGDAGLGKSRLAVMIQGILRGLPHTWLECHASLYTKAVPFHGVAELLRSGLRITHEQSSAARRRRLERVQQALGIEEPDFVPLFLQLLEDDLFHLESSGGGSGRLREEKVITLLQEWMRSLSHRQPVLILVEDLQWLDGSTLQLLLKLMESIRSERVLLLMTARPEFNIPWNGHPHLTHVPLQALDPAQSRELIRAVSEGRDLPAAAVGDVLNRADGVPRYLEELTRAALEKEIAGGEFVVPETLHDSLMAKLDDIPAPKEVAQVASILGKQFHYELLLKASEMDEATLREGLQHLVDADVLVQLGAPPKSSYLFKQTLLRDTAYQSMVRGTRERRHRRVADIIVESMEDMAEREPASIAEHYAQGGATRHAIKYWKLAAAQSRERHALEEALGYLNQALDSLVYIYDPRERRIQELEICLARGEALATVRGHAHLDTGEAYAKAETLAEECEDDFGRALASLCIGEHQAAQGFIYAAMDHFTQCLELARNADNEMLIICALQSLGETHFLLGEMEEAETHLKEAIERYDPELHDFDSAGIPVHGGQSAYCWGQWVSFESGDIEQAYLRSARSLEIGEAASRPVTQCMALCWSAMTAIHCGQGNRAVELAHRADRLAERMGYTFYRKLSQVLESLANGLYAGEFEDIQTCYESICEMVEDGHQVGVPWMLDRVADIHIRAGFISAAESTLRMAEEIAGRTCQFFRKAEIARQWAVIYLRKDEKPAEEIEEMLRSALASSREQGTRIISIRVSNTLAQLLTTLNRREEARTLLSESLEGFEDTIDTAELVTARALLRELSGSGN